VTYDQIEEILRGDVRASDPGARERARSRLRATITEEIERSPYRRRSRWTVLAIASAVAASIFILQLLLPPGPAGPGLSAAAEIRHMGELSAGRSALPAGPSEFIYQRYEEARPDSGTTMSGSSFFFDVLVVVETWSAADGSGFKETTYKSVEFASPLDRQNWEQAGSPPLVPTKPVHDESEQPGSLAVYDVDSLPTDPDTLRAALADGSVIVPGEGSRNLLSTIGTLLAQGNLSGDLRQALFEVAATIPGISVEHDVVDRHERAAVAVTATDGSTQIRLFFDPADAGFLGREITHPPEGVHPETIEWRAYLESGVVSSIGERPTS
jgi:hypothetical protein